MKTKLSISFLRTLAVAFAPIAATTPLVLAQATPQKPPSAAPAIGAGQVAASGTTPPAASANAADETVRLDDVSVEGTDVAKSVLPIRPNNAFYGFDELLKDTPRSIFQVSKAQIENDFFHNFSDLARYSPSISRGTSSNFSTFAKIRGGSADTTRNGILLLNPAVRPFDNNAWESVDIVAGVPSVIQGSTTRTAGVINYVTKKPLFDGEHLVLSTTLGRLGLRDNTTYGQYTATFDYNRVLAPDEFAVRVSAQKTDAKQYWGNARSNFEDLYAASTWTPSTIKGLRIDTNFTYTNSRGPMPYGINRVDQELLDKWTYRAGPYSPTVSWNGGIYRGYASNPGVFEGPGGVIAPAPWTDSAPAILVGWSQRPEDATRVPIDGDQIIYTKNAFSDTYEIIAQNITELKLNEHFTLRNNTLFQYSKSYVFGYDEYHSFMVNKMFTTRFEFLTDHEFSIGGSRLRHQSNSGFEYRFLWNLCDNAGHGAERVASDTPDATNPADGGGSLGTGTVLGVDNIYADPSQIVYVNGLPYFPVETKYGWFGIAPAYAAGGGRYAALSVRALSGTDLRINQLQQYNFFTEQKLSWETVTWRIGARVTAIRDTLRATNATYTAVNAGILTDYDFNDDVSEFNYDINTSIAWSPAKWATVYAAFDHDVAAGDCGCCLTQGFMSEVPGHPKHQQLNRGSFRLKSELFEVGAKFEIIPSKLFASTSIFHQTRYTPTPITAYNIISRDVKQTFQGFELAISYQPTNSLATGFNYSYIDVKNDNGSRSTGIAHNNANLWATYTFPIGIGLKASAWVTSDWLVSPGVHVPVQYNLDLGAFYTYKNWRFDVDVTNVTNEKNWSPSGNYAGDAYSYLLPQERLGVQFKVTASF
ncbi:MAG: TonB-dependent receptor plug domain-containing protein [Puniceicoccales bacterium]|nr:TonB-dependent receptor plug domain-containing protein [Puniceicoccales bacterium]